MIFIKNNKYKILKKLNNYNNKKMKIIKLINIAKQHHNFVNKNVNNNKI